LATETGDVGAFDPMQILVGDNQSAAAVAPSDWRKARLSQSVLIFIAAPLLVKSRAEFA